MSTTSQPRDQTRRCLPNHRTLIPCAPVQGPPPDLVDQLVAEVAQVVRRQLGGHAVRQVWSEPGRVLFRLADGTTGDVEVNWDVGTAEGDKLPGPV